VQLPPKAFNLLKLLVEKRPQVVSKQELYEEVWPGT
jgi:DNA-binding winged helix-turn-helix (wHTH) protein